MAELSSFDGTTLYFEEEGEGTPVVLLHGLSSSTKGNWKDPGIWGSLVAAGKRVIGLDARGHGRSGKPHEQSAYEDGAMVKDVGALFDHLGLEEADLVGYSMGAGTALNFAVGDERLRRLVLGGIGGDPARWGETTGRRAEMVARWREALEADSVEDIQDPAARGARKLFEARGNDLKAMSALLRGNRHLSPDTALDRVQVPTLVVCGDKDVSPEKLAGALPNGKALILAGDHEGVVANPELARAITDFVT